MGAMVVEVGPEIEQLVFEIRRSPEQNVIQILPSNGADQPFHERMRQWNVGDGLDFCHVQYPEVGLPLVEPIKRIVIGTEEVRHPASPSNGAVEHPTKCDTIDRPDMDAEANDPARVLIHDHQDPVRNMADSHRKRSMLQRLSLMWPRNVSQEEPPESCPGR